MSRPARLQRRLMFAVAGFVVFTAALFGLYALAFMYSVEDSFFNAMLAQEAQVLEREHARSGVWGEPRDAAMRLYRDAAEFPDDLRTPLQAEPHRREFAGADTRHYHVLAIDPAPPGARVWLVAEVSSQLVVRPMRSKALMLLGVSGLVLVAAALALGLWIARRIAGPLARLAAQVAVASPESLPRGLSAGLRDDEVGTLARGLDALLDRIDAFVVREREFTRDASHELRTPLAVIRSAAERLAADAHLDAAARERVGHIQRSALQLTQTVTTLLALARDEHVGSPVERTALLPLVERVVIEQSPLLGDKPVGVDVAIPADVCIALPAAVLNILLANLVGNAFAHTAAGTVRIDVAAGRLRIANRGDGADPARRWRSPQPFGKGEGSDGFGLGLVIVRRLCDRYGVDLRIEDDGDDVVASVALATARVSAPGPCD